MFGRKNKKWLRNKLLIQEVLRGQRPLLIYDIVTQRANPNTQNYAEQGAFFINNLPLLLS